MPGGFKGNRLRVLKASVMAVMLAVSANALAQDRPDLSRAQALVNEGKAAEAYTMLAPFEDKLAGDQSFDYLLGIAALDSGKPDRATIAFERVLAVNPNFAGARLDLARAYFQLGDLERAKKEFETVRNQNPPEGARKTVDRYMEAIDEAERAKKRRAIAWLELTVGYDTNVNNSTNQSVINVPALGNLAFTLNPTNVATEDWFATVSGGAEYARALTDNFGYFVGADWRNRMHQDQDLFDQENREIRGGFTFGPNTSQLRLTLQGGEHLLDRDMNRKVNGLGADYKYQLDAATQLSAFTNYTRVRFTDPIVKVNSFNASTYGVGALRLLGEGRAALFGALFAGEERDTDGRADGSKDYYGLRIGGQYTVRADLDLFAMTSAQKGEYGRTNAAFLRTREDEMYDLTLGAAWRFAPQWTLRPVLLYIKNKSNIPLFEYDRTEASLTVRRDFNF